MEVRVLLFGPEADALGRREAPVEVREPVTCARVKDALALAHPALTPFLPTGRLAINACFAAPETPIAPGDEVALIGLVSGG
jgi:molybdopterin converting factor small subunit